MTQTRLLFAGAIGALLVFSGCGDDDRRPVDSGLADSGSDDGGVELDSGFDAGMDAGEMDAGEMDAGDMDAGDMDAGDDTDAGFDGGTDGGNPVSNQIREVLATADGTGLSLPISGAFVTYVKPSVGGDDAGFFVQGEAAGPAIFVAIDPSTLSETPEAGDEVTFTVTDLNTNFGLREVTGLSGFGVVTSGNDISGLLQDVSSATDLVSALGDYESEYLTATFTIAAAFSGAGTGYEAAAIDTAGITGDTDLRFRIPLTLRASLDLAEACTLTMDTGVMWRFNDVAQLSVWDAADLSGVDCPAPTVTNAVATSPTEVVVSLDRQIDASSITDASTQFTITDSASGTLAVSAASVTGSNVTLTTATQTASETYTVTVAASVTDTLGVGVDAAANSTTFTGFVPPPTTVIINEVDYDQPGSDTMEFIELYNPGVGTYDLTGHTLYLVNGNDSNPYDTPADLGTVVGTIASEEYVILAANCAGLTLPSGTRCFDAFSSIQNGAPDGIAILDGTPALVDALSYEGSITAAAIGGSTYDLVEGTAATASDSGAESLQRIPNGTDTDDADADWQSVATPTPGAANTL